MAAEDASNPNATVEVTRCQLCGSGDSSVAFRDGPWTVLRCGGCGLVYVTPRIHEESLLEIYGEDYWCSDTPREKGYADYAADERLYLRTFRKRARLVDRFLDRHPANILDVGCAAGFFLRVMAERGHRVWGVEPAEAIGRVAEEHLGTERIHVGTLGTAPAGFAPGSFDLVTLWDVIEHVPDPQALLDRCRDMLRPGGVLLLETQNVDSLWARLTGRRWQHYKHEEHLYHFNPATVERLLRERGFEVLHNHPSYGGKYVDCAFVSERARRLHPVVGLLFRPLSLLGGLAFYLNLRDEMVVAARRGGD